MNTVTLLEKIWQIDNYTFGILWTDGVEMHYRLSELQNSCPCAGCKENPLTLKKNENVRAHRIRNVGRYALRIEYTSGCSAGIYDYELLRSMGEM
ncbi:MAG: DUF971 domain-containing protein [Chlamydiota bacterium]|nr:DUF971 domain-containing protein [Chlamydiota bacterium]